jgi:predicted Rossmann fold nucleotide-binding protein DprA/Smf involved in DNA uptake
MDRKEAMPVSPDSLAVLLVCSHLALGPGDAAPYNLREWNRLERALAGEVAHPASLLGCTAAELRDRLRIEPGEADRLASLLGRADALEMDLVRLASWGIAPLTRVDPHYPQRYQERLKESAPAVLFYAGAIDLAGQEGMAVVGSRELDETEQAAAGYLGKACATAGLVLYSGGARGADTISLQAALDAGGRAVAVLAESLEKAVQKQRNSLDGGRLCLITPYSPNAGFSVGAAMGRNRLIYTLADTAFVVACDAQKGGTWAGASEAIKSKWTPVFVLDRAGMPEGNRLLIDKGASRFPYPPKDGDCDIRQWLAGKGTAATAEPFQPSLF